MEDRPLASRAAQCGRHNLQVVVGLIVPQNRQPFALYATFQRGICNEQYTATGRQSIFHPTATTYADDRRQRRRRICLLARDSSLHLWLSLDLQHATAMAMGE